MKNFILKQLVLKNFKGIKNLEINFNEDVTNIFGANATGKTTIVDAFLWTLFDKDSTNRKDFQIKTLDENNEPLHGLEHSVTATILVNSKEIVITKIYKETWTKKRGEAEKLLTGHTTSYLIDDIPFKKSEYQNFINNLIDENIFKIITNPFYFSNVMKWEERRNILTDFVGNIEINKSVYLNNLLQDKTEKQLKDSLNFQKKELNRKLSEIPPRIDEVNNAIKIIDKSIITNKPQLESDLENINDSLYSFADANKSEKEKLSLKRSELNQIEIETNKENDKKLKDFQELLNKYEQQKQTAEFAIKRIEINKNNYSESIEKLQNTIEKLKAEFQEVSKTDFVFDESLSICPTCKRTFATEDIEDKRLELLANFNNDKAQKLTEINSKGKQAKAEIKELEKELSNSISELGKENSAVQEASEMILIINKDISKIEKTKIKYPKKWQTLKAEVEELENSLTNTGSQKEIDELRTRKNSIADSLAAIQDTERDIKENESKKKRIAELEAEQTNISSKIAEIEKGLFELEGYTKAKAEALEQNVNSKFQIVKFKMFNKNMNGGIEETCVALINGVPFQDANNASKYNAGLDIINTLSKHYGVTAPIFFDNRESVNELIHTDSQLINLIVSKDTELKIN